MKQISDNDLEKIIGEFDFDGDEREKFKKNLSYAIEALINANMAEKISEKLKVIFEYEKHYLDLIKEYKEEIKFANTLQEDLRRERAQFFSQNLKEVAETLKESQVDSDVASKWIQELVQSYTASLNICQGLADMRVIDTIGKLRKESSKIIEPVKFTEEE